jgi:hypothetical protein
VTRIIHLAPESARAQTVKPPEEAAQELMRSILNRIGFSVTQQQAEMFLERYREEPTKASPRRSGRAQAHENGRGLSRHPGRERRS